MKSKVEIRKPKEKVLRRGQLVTGAQALFIVGFYNNRKTLTCLHTFPGCDGWREGEVWAFGIDKEDSSWLTPFTGVVTLTEED